MDDFSAKAGVPNLYGLLDQANSIAPGKNAQLDDTHRSRGKTENYLWW
jgi:hypothetical protein